MNDGNSPATGLDATCETGPETEMSHCIATVAPESELWDDTEGKPAKDDKIKSFVQECVEDRLPEGLNHMCADWSMNREVEK